MVVTTKSTGTLCGQCKDYFDAEAQRLFVNALASKGSKALSSVSSSKSKSEKHTYLTTFIKDRCLNILFSINEKKIIIWIRKK